MHLIKNNLEMDEAASPTTSMNENTHFPDFSSRAPGVLDTPEICKKVLDLIEKSYSFEYTSLFLWDSSAEKPQILCARDCDRDARIAMIPWIADSLRKENLSTPGNCDASLSESGAVQFQFKSVHHFNSEVSDCLVTVNQMEGVLVCLVTGYAEHHNEFQKSDYELLFGLTSTIADSVRRNLILKVDNEQRKHIHQAKIQWEDAVDTLPQLLCVLNDKSKVIRTNRTLEAWDLGNVRYINHVDIHDLLHPHCNADECDFQVYWNRAWRRLLKSGKSDFTHFAYGIDRDVTISLVLNGHYEKEVEDSAFSFAVIEDITTQKRLEMMQKDYNRELQQNIENKTNQLELANRELQHISGKLLAAQEEERRKIASELHDGIGQDLSVIKIGIETAINNLGENITGESRRQLNDIFEKSMRTIDDVRRISMDLRPSILDDLGIVATIEWFSREYSKTFPDIDIVKKITIQDESNIPSTLRVAVFRIIQESFNNISKHAKADMIRMSLVEDYQSLKLCIEDNGRGFDIDCKVGNGCGYGLRSMGERAKLTGGTLNIDTTVGNGTIIEAIWATE